MRPVSPVTGGATSSYGEGRVHLLRPSLHRAGKSRRRPRALTVVIRIAVTQEASTRSPPRSRSAVSKARAFCWRRLPVPRSVHRPIKERLTQCSAAERLFLLSGQVMDRAVVQPLSVRTSLAGFPCFVAERDEPAQPLEVRVAERSRLEADEDWRLRGADQPSAGRCRLDGPPGAQVNRLRSRRAQNRQERGGGKPYGSSRGCRGVSHR